MNVRDVPVLIPQTYVVTGYDGRPRTVTFTPAEAPEAAANLNRQLKAGLRVPVCLMHDPDAYPEYVHLSHKDPDYLHQWRIAKGYIGDAQTAFVKDGRTFVRIGIPDPSDAKLFDKIGTVSPSLVRDWTDERGVTWKGLNILHIGVTPKPVQRDLPRASAYRGTSLSHAMWFSISIPTGRQVMADDKDMDKKPDMETEAEVPGWLVDALKQLEIHIVGDPKHMGELKVALESAIATKNGGVDEGADDDAMDMDDMDTESTEPIPAPALMSQWFPKLSEYAVKDREEQIKELVEKVDAQTIARLKKDLHDQVNKVELSQRFDAKCNFKPLDIDHELAAYAKLPKGKFTKDKANLGQTIPVPQPKDEPKGGPQAAADAVNEYFKTLSK